MSNTLKIFEHPTPSNIKQTITTPLQKGYGYVYAMEVGDYVKIGCTTKPHKRFAQIRQGATGYGGVEVGRFAVSASVKNYDGWEAELHRKFHKLRKPNTELFSIPFEVAVKCLVRKNEEEEIEDEFVIYNSSAYLNISLSPIYKDSNASQVFVVLISMLTIKKYTFTSITIIANLSGMSHEDVNAGLLYLEENEVIKITDCCGDMLIKFL